MKEKKYVAHVCKNSRYSESSKKYCPNIWIEEDKVDAYVSGDAQVYGDAWVSGDALVYGDARVYGDAWVSGNARIVTGKQIGRAHV